VDGGFAMLGPDQGLSPRHWFAQLAADAAAPLDSTGQP
jgi:hypothetical protein